KGAGVAFFVGSTAPLACAARMVERAASALLIDVLYKPSPLTHRPNVCPKYLAWGPWRLLLPGLATLTDARKSVGRVRPVRRRARNMRVHLSEVSAVGGHGAASCLGWRAFTLDAALTRVRGRGGPMPCYALNMPPLCLHADTPVGR